MSNLSLRPHPPLNKKMISEGVWDRVDVDQWSKSNLPGKDFIIQHRRGKSFFARLSKPRNLLVEVAKAQRCDACARSNSSCIVVAKRHEAKRYRHRIVSDCYDCVVSDTRCSLRVADPTDPGCWANLPGAYFPATATTDETRLEAIVAASKETIKERNQALRQAAQAGRASTGHTAPSSRASSRAPRAKDVMEAETKPEFATSSTQPSTHVSDIGNSSQDASRAPSQVPAMPSSSLMDQSLLNAAMAASRTAADYNAAYSSASPPSFSPSPFGTPLFSPTTYTPTTYSPQFQDLTASFSTMLQGQQQYMPGNSSQHPQQFSLNSPRLSSQLPGLNLEQLSLASPSQYIQGSSLPAGFNSGVPQASSSQHTQGSSLSFGPNSAFPSASSQFTLALAGQNQLAPTLQLPVVPGQPQPYTLATSHHAANPNEPNAAYRGQPRQPKLYNYGNGVGSLAAEMNIGGKWVDNSGRVMPNLFPPPVLNDGTNASATAHATGGASGSSSQPFVGMDMLEAAMLNDAAMSALHPPSVPTRPTTRGSSRPSSRLSTQENSRPGSGMSSRPSTRALTRAYTEAGLIDGSSPFNDASASTSPVPQPIKFRLPAPRPRRRPAPKSVNLPGKGVVNATGSGSPSRTRSGTPSGASRPRKKKAMSAATRKRRARERAKAAEVNDIVAVRAEGGGTIPGEIEMDDTAPVPAPASNGKGKGKGKKKKAAAGPDSDSESESETRDPTHMSFRQTIGDMGAMSFNEMYPWLTPKPKVVKIKKKGKGGGEAKGSGAVGPNAVGSSGEVGTKAVPGSGAVGCKAVPRSGAVGTKALPMNEAGGTKTLPMNGAAETAVAASGGAGTKAVALKEGETRAVAVGSTEVSEPMAVEPTHPEPAGCAMV